MKISILKNKGRIPGFVKKLLTAAFWLCVWQATYFCVGQEILVVSPACAFGRLFQLAEHVDFWLTALRSMARILEGFLIGLTAGTLAAVLAACSDLLRTVLQPLVHVIQATPVASFIILALVWMHADFVPIFAASLIVFPVAWSNVLEGIQKTDKKLLQMSRLFRFGRLKTVRRVYVPSAAPYFAAACVTSLGLSWKAGVAAEVLSGIPLSIGNQIYDAKIYLETADLFAWTAVVIMLSVLLEALMKRLMHRISRKYAFGL